MQTKSCLSLNAISFLAVSSFIVTSIFITSSNFAYANSESEDQPTTPAQTSAPVPEEKLYESLNTGWPESLSSLESQLKPNSNYVLLILKTPLGYIDLRTADQMRRSLLATPDKYRGDVGHTLFGWNCKSTGLKGFTSQSGERNFQSKTMLNSGWGLSTLMSTFRDGILYNPKQNDTQNLLPYKFSKTLRLYVVAVEVSDQECESVTEFVQAYANRNRLGDLPYLNFGFLLDPARLEGGGCSTVAVEALRFTEIFSGVEKYFLRHVMLPKKYFGRPLQLLPELSQTGVIPYVAQWVEPGTSVSLFKTVLSDWDAEGKNTIAMPLLDPELPLLMARKYYEMALQQEVSRGLISDRQAFQESKKLERRVYYIPKGTPFNEGNNSMTYDVVDETYDARTFYMLQNLKINAAKSGIENRIRRLKWGTQVAVVIEK